MMVPLTRGAKRPAVTLFQRAYNDRAKARGWPQLAVDGHNGPATLAAAIRACRALGAMEATLTIAKRTGTITVGMQRMVRWPQKRSKAQLTRARARAAASAGATPQIITATQLGLTFQWLWGSVGTLIRTYGHYTGGQRAKDKQALIATARAVHAQHTRQKWGGCSYGPMVADDGTLILMNPIGRKAAGVAGHNTGSVHLNVPGTTGDVMTPAAEATLAWYIAHAHTTKVPKAYRSPVDLRKLNGRVHKDDNATSCPGDYTPAYRRVL